MPTFPAPNATAILSAQQALAHKKATLQVLATANQDMQAKNVNCALLATGAFQIANCVLAIQEAPLTQEAIVRVTAFVR